MFTMDDYFNYQMIKELFGWGVIIAYFVFMIGWFMFVCISEKLKENKRKKERRKKESEGLKK